MLRDWIAQIEQRQMIEGEAALRLELAEAYHLLGVVGDEDASRRARRLVEQHLATNPDDRRAQAYLGSVTLIRAKRATLPWKKLALVNEAKALLDGAVAAEPENLELRLVRGLSARKLPEWMGRQEQAWDDIAYVADRAVEGLEDGRLSRRHAAAALLYDGKRHRDAGRVEEARERWERAVMIGGETIAAKEARAHLDER